MQVSLGRSFQLPLVLSGQRKKKKKKKKAPPRKAPAQQVRSPGWLLEGRSLAVGLRLPAPEAESQPQNIAPSGQEPNCFSQPRQRLSWRTLWRVFVSFNYAVVILYLKFMQYVKPGRKIFLKQIMRMRGWEFPNTWELGWVYPDISFSQVNQRYHRASLKGWK